MVIIRAADRDIPPYLHRKPVLAKLDRQEMQGYSSSFSGTVIVVDAIHHYPGSIRGITI